MDISLCVIAKNEEPFIEGCLKSARSVMGIADLVVADTGSSDNTKKLALSNGARVFDFEWVDDFSAARNFAAGEALNDWIIAVDADEEVSEIDVPALKKFMETPEDIGSVSLIEMADGAHIYIPRLYNKKFCAFKGSIHEQIISLYNENLNGLIKEVPVLIKHFGYVSGEDRIKAKLLRNEKLLEAALSDRPDNPYLLYQMGKRFFFKKSDLKKAREYFERALASGPDPELRFVYDLVECLGYALVNTGQAGKALELAGRYIKYYDKYAAFRFLRGIIYQNNGMLQEALESFESCVGASDADYKGVTSFLPLYNIGVILECAGMKDDAVKVYARCGSYAPAQNRLKELGF